MQLNEALQYMIPVYSMLSVERRNDTGIILAHFLIMSRHLGFEKEFFRKLYKYFVPNRDKILACKIDIHGQFYVKAYTADTFLFTEMNRSFRNLNPEFIFQFRDIYHYFMYLLK